MPIVLVGRPPKEIKASYVDVDNRQGAQTAVAHLISGGRRVIATIAGPQDMAAGIDRLRGYRDALADAGLAIDPKLQATGDFTQESGAAAMKRLLADRPDIDARLRRVRPDGRRRADRPRRRGTAGPGRCRRRRLRRLAGRDVSTTPQLTSVRQPIEAMGREVARLLVDAVEAADLVPRRVILATELVRRASSAGRPAP